MDFFEFGGREIERCGKNKWRESAVKWLVGDDLEGISRFKPLKITQVIQLPTFSKRVYE
jgi:hypothetical protein